MLGKDEPKAAGHDAQEAEHRENGAMMPKRRSHMNYNYWGNDAREAEPA